jgi:hypothetical protein
MPMMVQLRAPDEERFSVFFERFRKLRVDERKNKNMKMKKMRRRKKDPK